MTTTYRAAFYAIVLAGLIALSFPFVGLAQTAPTPTPSDSNTNTLQGILRWFVDLINNVLVPLIFALAFLLFLFGVFKFFFASGADAEEKRRDGRKFVMWAVLALAIMIVIWGIVNVLVNTIPGLRENSSRPTLPTFGPVEQSR